MHWSWHWPTALGDATLALPIIACAALLLAMQSRAGRTAARRWLTATGAAGVVVSACKIAFYGWGTGLKAWDLAMPSGHAAMGLILWPVLFTVLIPWERRSWRHMATAIGIAIGMTCAWSRVALRAHPLSEAVFGSAIGLAAMAFALPSMQGVHLRIPRGAVTAGGLLLSVFLWSVPKPRIQTEQWFARAGALLAGRPSPVARKGWHNTGAPSAPNRSQSPKSDHPHEGDRNRKPDGFEP